MERRHFIKGLFVAGLCPLCTKPGIAAEGTHWSYEGDHGPDHWAEMSADNAACSAGSQQSPVDITGAIKAELPKLAIDWKKGAGTVVNNGHTIQVNMPKGSTLDRGGKIYDLLQFHFHAPSEHTVNGEHFPMEVHFVHKNAESGALGVLGIFMKPGAANAAYGKIAEAFPTEAGKEASVDFDPAAFLPASVNYWAYEGSLTTPPCSEIVDWMVAMEPIEVDAGDIAKFTALYPMNARPALAPNRRFLLSSL